MTLDPIKYEGYVFPNSDLLLRCLNGRTAEVNGETVGAARLGAGDDFVIGRSRFWIARDAVPLR